MKIAHDVASFDNSVIRSVENRLRQRIGNDRMDLWFGGGAKWQLMGNNTIQIEVASAFVADCVSRMFRDDLQAVILETTSSDFGFQVCHVPQDTGASEGIHLMQPNPISNMPSQPIPLPKTREVSTPPLRVVRGNEFLKTGSSESHRAEEPDTVVVDRHLELRRENEKRWDDFIPGDHNRLAYTAAQMILERPGQINPFLIHGPNGTGKTHLAIGLAHKLRLSHRMRRVLVLTAEQFTIEYTESARGGGFASFRRKYRDVEAIVIDDIQFCLGKNGTLVELRNTIDMLLREKRQVILVADRGLHELSGLGADLFARLSGGMCCNVEPLDLQTRTGVLKRMCDRLQVAMDENTLSTLASLCSGDARVLNGIANRLCAQQRIQGRSISRDEALRCTSDLVRSSQPVVRIPDIERVVCDAFGLEEKSLRAKSKCQNLSQPRMLAMFLARKYTRTALSDIGEYFGRRQHSTVISAQKKVEQWIESDDQIACGRGQVAVRDILKNLESMLQVS